MEEATHSKPPETQPDPSKKLYLVLRNVFEGDVEVLPGQYKHSFILYMTDVDSNQYACPIVCDPNHEEQIRKSLSRLKPLILEAIDETKLKDKQEFEITDIRNMDNNPQH